LTPTTPSNIPISRQQPHDDFLVGRSDFLDYIRDKDWSTTPLGALEEWPQSLRTTISLCLASNFPINIIWGPDHTQVYNDGYRIVCGDAHPRALGESYRKTWASAWPVIGKPFEQALKGETSFLENQRMFLTRNGYLEETFFTYSLSPIRDESGAVGGVFHPVTETTATILADRRTRTLRELTAQLSAASTVAELTRAALLSLAQSPFDVPFVLAYEQSAEGHCRLIGQQGCSDEDVLPSGEPPSASPWPISEALRQNAMLMVDNVRELWPQRRCGPYEELPHCAVILPIGVNQGEGSTLILIAGVSPRLPLTEAYLGFYELISTALSAGLATVHAREGERRRAEALAEIDRAKTTFFSNVSHEFRTPLTLMLGPLEEALVNGGELSEDMRSHIGLAHRNGQRLLRLVNTLLEFSRIEAGRQVANYVPTDISALTGELASTFRSAIERAGLSLIVDAPSIPRVVNLDREMWEKIILNLLSNAFKFTFEGSITIMVRAWSDGKQVDVSVRDTGTGIAQNEIPRLFERFHRVEGARGRSIEGSGIGLALVYELVKLQGGGMKVRSEIGRGSEFTITLPMGDAPLSSIASDPVQTPGAPNTTAAMFVNEALQWVSRGADSAALAPVAVGQTPGYILLADDNADMRSYVKRLLSMHGFTVDAVPDGKAALAAARHRPPDLIVSDVMMPLLDGFQLLAELRADPELQSIPFILLSARAGEEARVEGLEAGADDYLTKPFTQAEFIARVVGVLTRARARREEVLRASEAHLRMLNSDLERRVAERSLARGRTWDLSHELIGVSNAAANFENCNPAWRSILGYTEAEVTGRSIFGLIHAEDLEKAKGSVARMLQIGRPLMDLEIRCQARSGEYRWLSWTAVPESEKIYWSARDITEEKARATALTQAQEHLRQSQKMEAVGQLTGGLAHDFNNLLTGITGSLELVQSRVRQGRIEEVEKYINAAQSAARRAAALTHRLLAFSRRQTLDPKPININRLVLGMGDLIQRTIGPEIALESVSGAGLWSTLVDPSQLENALLNLCINARDAMPTGGKLTIEASNRWLDEQAARERDAPPGQYVSLCVSDTGTGMSPEVKERAFDPFFTTKPIGMGTGLGLSMIYGFARQSGGEVRIYSELDKGTMVCLYLPRHVDKDETLEVERTVPELPRAEKHETVLVVDDEPTVRMLVSDVLQEAGYTTIEAEDGVTGLKILNSAVRIDLLVSDVGLPGGMNGRQLADAARVARPELKVLFITGYAENAVLNHGHLSAGMHVLTKPFTVDNLSRRVKDLIRPM